MFEELTNEELTPGLLTPLEEEIDQLSNVEALQHYLAQSIYLIDEEQVGLLTQFTSLKSLLKDAANQSKKFNLFHDRVDGLFIELKDILDDLTEKQETLDRNPILLEKLTQRWDKIQSLFQKHNVYNVEDLIEVRDNLAKELEQSQDLDKRIGFLKDKIHFKWWEKQNWS